MKIFKHSRGIKARVIKLKGRLKTLLVRKSKRHTARKYKKMFTSHNATLNTLCDENIAAQSILLEKNVPPDRNSSFITERTSRQLSSKCKKKQGNKKTAYKCFAEDTTSWDNSEQQIQEEEDHNRRIDISNKESRGGSDDECIQIVPMEQRNLDSPIVVQMPLDDSAALSMPKIFEQRFKKQPEIDTYDRNVFVKETWSTEDNAYIIDSEYMNPDNTHSPAEHEELASPVSWDMNETDKTENNEAVSNRELKNVDEIDEISNVDSIPVHRESIESSEISISNDSAKVCKSPQLDNTCEFDREDDLNSEIEDNAVTNNSRENASPHNFKDISMHLYSAERPQLYSFKNIVIVIMKKDNAFSFIGKLSVKVLYGAIKVYGAILNASKNPMRVYSPRGYSNIVIETYEDAPDGTIDDIWTALSAKGITQDSETKLLNDIQEIKPGMAVLVLQNIENNLTHFLETYYPLRLFPRMRTFSYYPWTDYRRAQVVLQAQLNLSYRVSSRRELWAHPCITDIANEMLVRWRENSWSCALIAGGKDTGKSTSVRFLINTLLNTCEKVVLVDVDPGQSECTPAACVSYSLIEQPLLGPNFTHLQMPVYQIFLGEIDVMQCVFRYLEALNMLITKLKSCPELSRLPIVINTMGFTQNVGWPLMIYTIKLFRPFVILQIASSNRRKNFKDSLDMDTVNKQNHKWASHAESERPDWHNLCDHKLFTILSNAKNKDAILKKWNMEPYQHRELVMISYLSGITRHNYDPYQCNDRLLLRINEVVPYKTSFSSLCIIPPRMSNAPASHVLNVINGNIVALCGIDLAEEFSQDSNDTSDLRVFTHSKPLCTCYGFGIVRGVDIEKKEVYINTPLPQSMMQYINCLAGCIHIPPSLLQVYEGAPYISVGATLPTSRQHRKGIARGYFHTKPQKKSKTDGYGFSQDAKSREDTTSEAPLL